MSPFLSTLGCKSNGKRWDKSEIREVDAILISTPEYNYSTTGT
ncbi:MAG: hypothetical protein WA364_20955 [Candidatus Nitrosopolaris sp.]